MKAGPLLMGLVVLTSLVTLKAHAVSSLGVLTCQQFNEVKTADVQGQKKAAVFWVMGYLSGVANGTQRELLDKVQVGEVIDFVADYCSLNPTRHMQEAASALEFVLKKRKGP